MANFFRGQEEIEVLVRNDPESLSMASINSFLIKSPQDIMVPLGEVVVISKKQGFSVIKDEMVLEKSLLQLK